MQLWIALRGMSTRGAARTAHQMVQDRCHHDPIERPLKRTNCLIIENRSRHEVGINLGACPPNVRLTRVDAGQGAHGAVPLEIGKCRPVATSDINQRQPLRTPN